MQCLLTCDVELLWNMPPLNGMSSNLCTILAFSESSKLLLCDPMICSSQCLSPISSQCARCHGTAFSPHESLPELKVPIFYPIGLICCGFYHIMRVWGVRGIPHLLSQLGHCHWLVMLLNPLPHCRMN